MTPTSVSCNYPFRNWEKCQGQKSVLIIAHTYTPDLHDCMCAQTNDPLTLTTVTTESHFQRLQGRRAEENEQACQVLLLVPLVCNVSLLDVRGSGRIQWSLTPRKQPENWNSDSLSLLVRRTVFQC